MNRDALALALVDARVSRGQIPQPSELHESFDLAEAYEVASSVSERWRGLGNHQRGIKIGLTYRPVWEKIGLSHPVWAPVYAADIADGELSVSNYVAPRIEPEVVLSLRSDLEPGATRTELAQAVEWATLGFEIVDCHYPGWRLTPPDLIADFGCHAGLALAEPMRIDVQNSDLSRVEVGLVCDDDEVASGSGTAVLDGPLDCLFELLSARSAPNLCSGDLIATGSLTGRSHPVSAGQTWRIVASPSSPLRSRELKIAP
jgi:2-keto-4-pentenoate hydratase